METLDKNKNVGEQLDENGFNAEDRAELSRRIEEIRSGKAVLESHELIEE